MIKMRVKSSKARKQRKYLYEAPIQDRRRMLSSHLSKEMREKYSRRAFPVRLGDEVEVMRGEFRGKKGKISKLNLKTYKVYIEGIVRKKVEGTERMAAMHPSNLRITNLNLSDKRRVQAIERASKGETVGKEAKGS